MHKITVLLLLSLLYSCTNEEARHIVTGLEGSKIPVINLLSIDSTGYFSTLDRTRGKQNVVLYFSPTCPYSRALMRTIVDNIGEFKDVNFVVLTIADLASTKKFYNKYNLGNYRNISVGIDTGYIFPNYYRIQRVPFLAIYDKNDRLKDALLGLATLRQLETSIKSSKIIARNKAYKP